jgi:hypothetical protein
MKALRLSLALLTVLLFALACSSKKATPSPTTTPTSAVSPTTQAASALYVCVDVANVRSGPGTNYPVLKTLTQGASITPLQKSGEWYFLGQDDAKNDSYINESVVCSQSSTTANATAAATSPSSSGTGSCPTGCTEPPAGCTIKGNISAKTGEKIYFLPGDPGYNLVVIDPDYGERWFCTEAEARANGWQRGGQ